MVLSRLVMTMIVMTTVSPRQLALRRVRAPHTAEQLRRWRMPFPCN